MADKSEMAYREAKSIISSIMNKRKSKDKGKLIEEDVSFEIKEEIIPGYFNLGKIGHGDKGETYIAARIVTDKGDVKALLDGIARHTEIKEVVGMLNRLIEDREGKQSNARSVERAEEAREKLKDLNREIYPIPDNEALTELIEKKGAESELELIALKWLPKEHYSVRSKGNMGRERNLLSRLNNPGNSHIMNYIERVENHPEGMGFFCELIHGRTIDKIIGSDTAMSKTHPTTPKEVVYAMTYVVNDILCYLDKYNIAHQDWKTPNMMLTIREGRPVLVDFGQARKYISGQENGIDIVSGSIQFSAPEVVKNTEKRDNDIKVIRDKKAPYGPETERYSATAMIYEMAAKVLPIRGDITNYDVFKKIVATENPTPLSTFDLGYTSKESKILMRGLNKDPQARGAAEQSREDARVWLTHSGHDSHQKILNILENYLEPIRESIAESYKPKAEAKKVAVAMPLDLNKTMG